MTDDDAVDQPASRDETVVIPPGLAPTQLRAYSDVEDYDDPGQTDTQLAPAVAPQRHSWGEAWSVVAIVAMIVAVVVMGVVGWALLHSDAPPLVSSAKINGTQPAPPAESTTTTVALPPTSATPTSGPDVVSPSSSFSGRYTMTNTNRQDGHVFTQVWVVTPCGDGCANMDWEGHGTFAHAHLIGGFWRWDVTNDDAICEDGSRVHDAGDSHTEIDAILLRGTSHTTWRKGCPGGSTDPNTNDIVLTRATLPTPPTPAFSGRYARTDTGTDGRTATDMWNVTPCGDGCVDIKADGFQDTIHGTLIDGSWVMDIRITAVCPDGSKVPLAGKGHYVIDAATMRGSSTTVWNKPACGVSAGTTNTYTVVLTRAD